MTTTQYRLLALLLALAPASTALAQSKPKQAAKPATQPAARPAAKPTTATPAPKPAATPTPAPAAPAASARATRVGPFEVGTNALNFGIGIGSYYSYGSGYFGGSSSVSPAFSVSFERGFRELGPGVLGLGAIIGYQGASYDLGGGDKIKYNDIIVMVRGAWHYPVTPQFDAYGGVGLGVRHAGGRYFFSDSFGAFGEVGYDQSLLKVGLTLKL